MATYYLSKKTFAKDLVFNNYLANEFFAESPASCRLREINNTDAHTLMTIKKYNFEDFCGNKYHKIPYIQMRFLYKTHSNLLLISPEAIGARDVLLGIMPPKILRVEWP